MFLNLIGRGNKQTFTTIGTAYPDNPAYVLNQDKYNDYPLRPQRTVVQFNSTYMELVDDNPQAYDGTVIEPDVEEVRKDMYHDYIHWSCYITTKGNFLKKSAQVPLGQIDYRTNTFKRTFYHA